MTRWTAGSVLSSSSDGRAQLDKSLFFDLVKLLQSKGGALNAKLVVHALGKQAASVSGVPAERSTAKLRKRVRKAFGGFRNYLRGHRDSFAFKGDKLELVRPEFVPWRPHVRPPPEPDAADSSEPERVDEAASSARASAAKSGAAGTGAAPGKSPGTRDSSKSIQTHGARDSTMAVDGSGSDASEASAKSETSPRLKPRAPGTALPATPGSRERSKSVDLAAAKQKDRDRKRARKHSDPEGAHAAVASQLKASHDPAKRRSVTFQGSSTSATVPSHAQHHQHHHRRDGGSHAQQQRVTGSSVGGEAGASRRTTDGRGAPAPSASRVGGVGGASRSGATSAGRLVQESRAPPRPSPVKAPPRPSPAKSPLAKASSLKAGKPSAVSMAAQAGAHAPDGSDSGSASDSAGGGRSDSGSGSGSGSDDEDEDDDGDEGQERREDRRGLDAGDDDDDDDGDESDDDVTGDESEHQHAGAGAQVSSEGSGSNGPGAREESSADEADADDEAGLIGNRPLFESDLRLAFAWVCRNCTERNYPDPDFALRMWEKHIEAQQRGEAASWQDLLESMPVPDRPSCTECGALRTSGHELPIITMGAPKAMAAASDAGVDTVAAIDKSILDDAAADDASRERKIRKRLPSWLPVTGIAYDERMLEHYEIKPPKDIVHPVLPRPEREPHPERPDRLRAIAEHLATTGVFQRCVRVESRQAQRSELETVHTQYHVNTITSLSHLAEGEALHIGSDTYTNRHTAFAASLSCGTVLSVTEKVCRGHLNQGIAIVRPPGHHAEAEQAMGFCMFNNVAVAAAVARRDWGIKRVLIVDWDVHHGNGTQHMFEEDPSIMYFSTHRYDDGHFYPGTGAARECGRGAGAGYSINVPWPCGNMGDAEYIEAFETVLMPIARQFAPELVLVSAGFDAAAGDPLGGCSLTPAGYAHLTAMLRTLANGRVVIALEGGYNLRSISTSMEACARTLLGEPLPLIQRKSEVSRSEVSDAGSVVSEASVPGLGTPALAALEAICEVVQIQARYWGTLSVRFRAMTEVLREELERRRRREMERQQARREHEMRELMARAQQQHQTARSHPSSSSFMGVGGAAGYPDRGDSRPRAFNSTVNVSSRDIDAATSGAGGTSGGGLGSAAAMLDSLPFSGINSPIAGGIGGGASSGLGVFSNLPPAPPISDRGDAFGAINAVSSPLRERDRMGMSSSAGASNGGAGVGAEGSSAMRTLPTASDRDRDVIKGDRDRDRDASSGGGAGAGAGGGGGGGAASGSGGGSLPSSNSSRRGDGLRIGLPRPVPGGHRAPQVSSPKSPTTGPRAPTSPRFLPRSDSRQGVDGFELGRSAPVPGSPVGKPRKKKKNSSGAPGSAKRKRTDDAQGWSFGQ